jgi:hypothetical protein
LSDGRLFVAGGTKYGAVKNLGRAGTDIFDPFTRRWTRGPDMDFKRWYPTTTKLPDGDVLIFSGWRYEFPPGSDKYDPDFIEAVERFDSETNSMARLQRSANKESISIRACI